MFGKTRHGHAYYNCYPANNNADRFDRYPPDHPKAINVREDALIDALGHVIATRAFSADRHAYLRRGLAGVPTKRRAASLREQIADLTGAVVDKVITSALFQTPSTVAIHGGRLAVVNAKFDTGFPPTADQYEVVLVDR